ncbi:MAG: SpoIID/LytB domain-containing protein [Armatimonadetes bacterium]|nr:SpoIID/LytB domain-containing protein [Armatimonadota bacterium]
MRLIIAAIFFLMGCECYGEPVLRVGILRTTHPGSVRIICESGAPSAVHSKDFTISSHGSMLDIAYAGNHKKAKSLTLENTSAIRLRAWDKDHRYTGKLLFSARDGNLLIVNEVSLEDYVRGVVANEMRKEWPIEALKAQAVVARTLALTRYEDHKRDGFDICDATHCQVYRGIQTETSETNAAVRQTSGQILTYRKKPIQALYGSCCGGVSASSYASQSLGNAPYLRIRKDILNSATACKASPHYDWNFTVTASDLASALASDSRTNVGKQIKGLRVIKNDASDRALYMEIAGSRSREIDAYVFWNIICRKLGWGSVKSARFRLTKSGDTYTFCGHGLGHGIGLCQWGAYARAKSGWNYQQILAFYYSGAGISKVAVEKISDMQ